MERCCSRDWEIAVNINTRPVRDRRFVAPIDWMQAAALRTHVGILSTVSPILGGACLV